jgi:outer membrane protein assembly factor BamE (lipoprotein component of BamABCDE complex)
MNGAQVQKILSILLLSILATPACFFSRSKLEVPIDAGKIDEIVVGKSTKDDVVRVLGAPTDIIFSNREHDALRVFAYEYTYTVNKTTGFTIIILTFLNSDRKRDHVLVFFDEQGVVTSIGVNLDAEKASYELPFGD